jgi:hypothetical protein
MTTDALGGDRFMEKDNFARHAARRANEAVGAVRKDVQSLVMRLQVVETKTNGLRKLGRCALCGEPCRGRHCPVHRWVEGFDEE